MISNESNVRLQRCMSNGNKIPIIVKMIIRLNNPHTLHNVQISVLVQKKNWLKLARGNNSLLLFNIRRHYWKNLSSNNAIINAHGQCVTCKCKY